MNVSLLAFASGNWQLAGSIFFGLFLGALLSWAGFTDASRVKAALKFDDRELVLTALATLFFAILFIQVGNRTKFLCLPLISSGALWSSLAGGILCGIGLAMAGLAPLSALGSFASGKIGTLVTIAGMIASLVTYPLWREKLTVLLTLWNKPLGKLPETPEIFHTANAALWIVAGLALFILILQWKNKGK